VEDGTLSTGFGDSASAKKRSARAEVLEQLSRDVPTEDVIIQPKGPHSHTVIMLHGCGGTGSDFVSAPDTKGLKQTIDDLEVSGTDGIKYIFPTAPKRKMYWHGLPGPASRPMHAWYTYYSDYEQSDKADNDEINQEEYDASVQQLVDLVLAEATELGDASKVAIGGYSQGGTTAISAAMNKWSKGLPAALVGIDTLPMAFTKANPDNVALPIYHFVGADDVIYPVDLQKKDFGRLASAGFTLTERVQPGVGHFPINQFMFDYAAKWICEAFFSASQQDGFSDQNAIENLEFGARVEQLDSPAIKPSSSWLCC